MLTENDIDVWTEMARQLSSPILRSQLVSEQQSQTSMTAAEFYHPENFFKALFISARRFKKAFGFLPNCLAPVTFNERIFTRKFFSRFSIPTVADKLYARHYVSMKIGEQFLPLLAWQGTTVEELFAASDLLRSTLPAGKYVLKSNFGCGYNLFLDLPGALVSKRGLITHLAAKWEDSKFGLNWGEWHYSTFERRLLLEHFIDFNQPATPDEYQSAKPEDYQSTTPDDYKFYCFHGKVRVVLVARNRFSNLVRSLHTRDWAPLPWNNGQDYPARPRNLDEMIRIAERLAEDFDFARVDLYSDGIDKVVFGEITLTPGNGDMEFASLEFDRWLGSWFDSPNVPEWKT